MKEKKQLYINNTLTPYRLVRRNKIAGVNFEISKVEELRKATFVGEVCLMGTNKEWANTPVALFYTETAHPQGSNYFGLFFKTVFLGDSFDSTLMITDGISAVVDKEGNPVVYTGILNKEWGEVYYSAYRHDCQSFGDFMIDGGRDYTRHSLNGELVQFIIEKNKFKLLDKTSEVW